jgi:hypothetical protein
MDPDQGEGSAAGAAGEDDLRPGAGAAGEGGGGEQFQDRAEEAMDGRLRARPDRREENSLRRALRDRAILLQEHAEKDRELAAMRALLAKQNAEGLGSQLERAERDSADAHSAGDPEAIARANRRMAELAAGRTAAVLQHQAAEREAAARKAEAERARAQPEPAPMSERTSAWLAANPWYGQDQDATTEARLAHDAAVARGFSVDSDDYWRYIERRVDGEFPGRVRAQRGDRPAARDPDGGADPQPADAPRRAAMAGSGTAPVMRRSPTSAAAATGAASNKPLSAEQREVARMLGISEDAYRAQAERLRAKSGSYGSQAGG